MQPKMESNLAKASVDHDLEAVRGLSSFCLTPAVLALVEIAALFMLETGRKEERRVKVLGDWGGVNTYSAGTQQKSAASKSTDSVIQTS